MRGQRTLVAALVLGMAAAILPAVAPAQTPLATTDSAAAAEASQFDPGYIISDDLFYSSNAMSVDAIQQFLNSKVASCRAGYTCLKDYQQWTTFKPVDRYCPGGFGTELFTAAQIIEGVSRSCGVSAKVLLVLLQKEQALVTDNFPTDRQYRSATGYGCPDTAACDSNYYGFFNQVYSAARQFKNYQANPTNWRYRAGRTNYIQYNPDASCGGTDVFIQNQATAGLYIYTPYQPNASALANLYGSGDGCGAYGNRNFWRLYTDWFGSTNAFPVTGGIGEYYVLKGGGLGSGLGFPTGPQYLADPSVPGWIQRFENGAIYWSAAGGGRTISGGIGIAYEKAGGASGTGLGFPIDEQAARGDSAGGWVQSFQNGRLYWTPAGGGVPVYGGISGIYESMGGPSSSLGYPVSPSVPIEGGWRQDFAGGTIYWGLAGGRVVSGALLTAYQALGSPATSGLGFPFADAVSEGGGRSQRFLDGWLYTHPSYGSWVVQGGIGISYQSRGGATLSGLGFPAGKQRPIGRGWVQPFVNGSLYWTPGAGGIIASGGIGDFYRGLGGPTASGLGFPIADQTTDGTTWMQRFEFGTITFTGASGASVQYASSSVAAAQAAGGLLGPIGAQTQARANVSGTTGWVERYANGSIYGGPSTGSHRVSGGIGIYYESLGGPVGSGLGLPTEDSLPLLDGQNGWMQRFENGAIYWTPTWGAQRVTGRLASGYDAAGGPTGQTIGYPVRDASSSQGVDEQQFSSGPALWSSSGGYVTVTGGIGQTWLTLKTTLGLPVSSQFQIGAGTGGWGQRFTSGWIYWSPQWGSQVVSGGLGIALESIGGPGGSQLGNVTGPARQVGAGWYQPFVTGRLYWSASTLGIVVGGGIGQRYFAGGGEASSLGLPAGPSFPRGDGGWSQTFAGGSIFWSPAGGGRVVGGGIGERYLLLGGPAGSGLGYPTGEQIDLGGGNYVQYFQRGRINWVAGNGAVVSR